MPSSPASGHSGVAVASTTPAVAACASRATAQVNRDVQRQRPVRGEVAAASTPAGPGPAASSRSARSPTPARTAAPARTPPPRARSAPRAACAAGRAGCRRPVPPGARKTPRETLRARTALAARSPELRSRGHHSRNHRRHAGPVLVRRVTPECRCTPAGERSPRRHTGSSGEADVRPLRGGRSPGTAPPVADAVARAGRPGHRGVRAARQRLPGHHRPQPSPPPSTPTSAPSGRSRSSPGSACSCRSSRRPPGCMQAPDRPRGLLRAALLTAVSLAAVAARAGRRRLRRWLAAHLRRARGQRRRVRVLCVIWPGSSSCAAR